MTGPRHVAVGFYLNGDYKISHVKDEDLERTIQLNRDCRFGRFFFVDGKYVCGGVLLPEPQARFISECKARLSEIDTSVPDSDCWPYA